MNIILYWWYCICLILLVYNLNLLEDEANEIFYDYKEKSLEHFEFLFCFPLRSVLRLIDDEERRMKIERNQLILVPELLSLTSDSLNTKFNIKINRLQSVFHNNHTCFAIDNQQFKNANYFHSIDYLLFPYSNETYYPFSQRIYQHTGYKKNFTMLIIEKFVVLYKSNRIWRCEYDSKLDDETRYTYFKCINLCLKRKSTKVIYHYQFKENVVVNLSDNLRNLSEENECKQDCLKRVEDCLFEHYNSFSFFLDGQNSTLTYDLLVNKYNAFFAIDSIDFCLQFIGLCCLFVNISFIQTFPALLKNAIKFILKFKFIALRRRVNGWFKKSKIYLNILSACLFIALSFMLILDFYRSIRQPIMSKTFVYTSNYNPISIVLCASVQSLIFNTIELTELEEEKILNNFTFEMIEKHTNDGLDKVLAEIYLSFESRRKHLDWTKSKKVLFKFGSFSVGDKKLNLLQRCFRIEFDLIKTNYEHFLLITNVLLRTKNNTKSKIFILEKEKKLLTDSQEFLNPYKLSRIIKRRSMNSLGSNCIDYSLIGLNCSSRRHCIEQCKVYQFLSNYSSLTIHSIIDKDEISLLDKNFNNLHFNRTYDNRTEFDCENKFIKEDCKIEKLSLFYGFGHRELNEFKINLYYFAIYYVEVTSRYSKLLLKLLSLIGIIYGLNMQSILYFILSFKLFRLRYDKFLKHFVLAICLIGFSIHLITILFLIIGSRFTNVGHFSGNGRLDDTLIPDIALCINWHENMKLPNLDKENFRFTANYLNKITSNYTFESLIYRIDYLKNGTFSRFEFKDYEQNYFIFDTFFIFNLKCLQISIKIVYDEDDLYYLEDIALLKLYLNRTNLPEFFYLIFKPQNTKQIYEIVKLSPKQRINYKVRLDNFENIKIDKFRFLRKPLAYFYELYYDMKVNDVTSYFNKILKKFNHKYNLTTSLIILEKANFNDDLEINDDLFEQFYSQVQNSIDRLASPNVFAKTSIKEIVFSNELIDENDRIPDFEFYNSFFILNTKLINENNFINFLQVYF